ncbi:hypothetical protein JCM11251_005062 [Rhodosporidiobolus azoricus]
MCSTLLTGVRKASPTQMRPLKKPPLLFVFVIDVPPALSSPSKPPTLNPFDAPLMPGAPPVDPSKAETMPVATTNLSSVAANGAAPAPPAPAAPATGGLGAAPNKPKEDEFEALRKRFDDLKKR